MMSTKRNGIATNKATPSTPPSTAGRRALEEGAVGCMEPIYTNTLFQIELWWTMNFRLYEKGSLSIYCDWAACLQENLKLGTFKCG